MNYKSFSNARWEITIVNEFCLHDLAGGMQNGWRYKAVFKTKNKMEGIPQKFETNHYSNIKYLKNVVIRRIINNNKMENVYSGYDISNNNKKDNIGYSGS